MPHGWSSADAQRFIHGRVPFSSCFSPSVSFLRAKGSVWGLSRGAVRRAQAAAGCSYKWF